MANIVFFVFLAATLIVCSPAVILQLRHIPSGKSLDHAGTVVMYVTFLLTWTIAFMDLCRSDAVTGSRTIGLAIFCSGAGIRTAAFWALGRMYSGSVNIQTGHILVRTGIYRVARHPLHLGLIVEIAGLALMAPAWTGAFCLVLACVFIVRRNQIEDAVLQRQFGPTARQYQAQVPGMNVCRWLWTRRCGHPGYKCGSIR